MERSCNSCVHNDSTTAILTKAVCRLCSRLGNWEPERSCSTCKWSSKKHPSRKNCVDNGANPQLRCGGERSLWELHEGKMSFWMVLTDGSTYISTRYRNFQDAQNKAISEARLYPGNKYYVLQAKYSFQVGVPEIKKEVLL